MFGLEDAMPVDLYKKLTMVLITYMKPYVMIYADKMLTGKLFINDSKGKLLWNSSFKNKDLINIKVDPGWQKSITVTLQAEGKEIKKTLSI